MGIFPVVQVVHTPVTFAQAVQLVPQLGQLFSPSLYFPAPQFDSAAQVVPMSIVPDGQTQLVL